MCLTIPKQVISVKNGIVVVKSANEQQKLATLVAVKKGDWVLSLNNVIIKKISKKEAEEINQITSSSKYPKKGGSKK